MTVSALIPGQIIHYVSQTGLADSGCIAGIVTDVTDPEHVTVTLFYTQGVPASGVYAAYDNSPAGSRASGSWHWPGLGCIKDAWQER